ncbi:MAG: hypothetical protein HY290_03805 [Planctomycetia bacterium]|nr:hypothetical protein [Planctomycetia bacterium]
MSSFTRYSVGSLFVLAACLPAVLADDPPADADTPATRQQRLEYLKSRAAECELFKEGERNKPLAFTREPLLRYSNPVRGFKLSDGGTFLWLDGERPLAVATWSIRGPGNIYREFTSLSAEPLSCRREERELWLPKTGGLMNQLLPEAPPPLPSATRRLGQMRDLAGRFSAVVHLPPDETTITELRLMSRPIYRYKQETPDVLDGALFSFVEATDPEALLLLEARRGKATGEYEWRYTLARMTSVRLIMRLDGKECWSVTNFWRSPKSPNDPYVEAADGKYVAEK